MKNSNKSTKDLADDAWIEGCRREDGGDLEGAMKYYEIAAKLNHSDAQSNLGNLIDDKLDLVDKSLAIYWYKRSVKNGNGVAAWNLHRHYENLGKNRWSLYWMNVAAEMGHDGALELKGAGPAK